MTALFIGVFTVGLVVALGQGLQVEVNRALVQNAAYNIMVQTSGEDTARLEGKLRTVPGLLKSRTTTSTQDVPITVCGKPVQEALPQQTHERQMVLGMLSGIEGYDLSLGTPETQIAQGRNLNTSDAGTNNIVVSDSLTGAAPLHMTLKVGDTITFTSMDAKVVRAMTIVGISTSSSSESFTNTISAPSLAVRALASANGVTPIIYMKVDSAQVTKALDEIEPIVRNAKVQSIQDIAAYAGKLLNNLLAVLIANASLSLIAGIIIIANAVALAMLERRRELGILKAVGYTRTHVLSEVLMENGVIGATVALLASLLVVGAVAFSGNLLFHLSFSVSLLIILGLVGGAALLTAALVAWSPANVRSLEVLRYE